MDQHELVSWILVITGLLICLAALVKGAMSLFTRAKSEENGSMHWDVDWGGIVIAALMFSVGLWVIGEGFDVKEDADSTPSEQGQGLAEYGLILALIAVVVAGAILLVDLF